MKLVFAEQVWEDYLYWQKTDRQLLDRTNTLIKDIIRSPFAGIGKPEPLQHAPSGYWSRRINDEHRIENGRRRGADCAAALSLLSELGWPCAQR